MFDRIVARPYWTIGRWMMAALAFAAAIALMASPVEAKKRHYYYGYSGGIYSGSGFGFTIRSGKVRGSIYYGSRYGGPYYRPGFGPRYRPGYGPGYYNPRYYPRRVYRPYRPRVYPGVPYVLPAPPVYRAPVHRVPAGIPYTKTGLAPYTPEWFAYCSRKFKSFDPRSGTYLAYSGKRRYCR